MLIANTTACLQFVIRPLLSFFLSLSILSFYLFVYVDAWLLPTVSGNYWWCNIVCVAAQFCYEYSYQNRHFYAFHCLSYDCTICYISMLQAWIGSVPVIYIYISDSAAVQKDYAYPVNYRHCSSEDECLIVFHAFINRAWLSSSCHRLWVCAEA